MEPDSFSDVAKVMTRRLSLKFDENIATILVSRHPSTLTD